MDKAVVEIRQADLQRDSLAIAQIHFLARRHAMAYLNRSHADEETRDYFARVVGDGPAAWWW